MDEEQVERPATAAPRTRARPTRAAATRSGTRAITSRRAGARGGKRRPAKPVRWSIRREETFLASLAQTSNVAASARAAGLSESSIYRRRAKDEAFRARWSTALREGVAKLETMLLDRALNGVEKAVWHGGKQVGTMTEYSERLALALLAAHRGAGTDAVTSAPLCADEVRRQFLDRLSEMNRAMGGAG